MIIKRDWYLNQLIKKKDNGRVKIITGIRRCGKSFLLFELFTEYLRSAGVEEEQIIKLALDEFPNAKYRNPMELDSFIRGQIINSDKKYYVLIDEIQYVADIKNPFVDDSSSRLTFVDVVIGLMKIKNADIYISGSNSKMLSSDILTQFRDRGDEIRVYPLSFAEFLTAYQGERHRAWTDYCTYGGMPYAWTLETHEERSKYLRDLCERTYIKDVVERNRIFNDVSSLDTLLDIVSSSVGSLTNPKRLSDSFLSEAQKKISPETVEKYLNYFCDAFILQKAARFDVKGKKYMKTPYKYYFTDVGLRNARLHFRQQEENHIMENIVFNELVRRGFDVDVGLVEQNTTDEKNRKVKKQLEIDFVVNKGNQRFYIQSSWMIPDEEKKRQETASLIRIPDSFRKIVVTRDYIHPYLDDNGILFVDVEQFLLNEKYLKI